MNKESYLKIFYGSLNDRLCQMISTYKEDYLDTLSEEDKNPVWVILDKKKFTLLDINDLLIDYSSEDLDDASLFAIVYRYFDTITTNMVKGDLVFLDFPVRHRLEKVPTSVPKFLMLPILSYLTSSSNKYQTLTRELYGNYLTYLENDFTSHTLKTLKLDISGIFDKLSTITTDPNYEITLVDINLLSSFLLYERYLPGIEMEKVMTDIQNIQGIKDITISHTDTGFPFVISDIPFDDAMKVYSHFFKLELPKKCSNRYLYAKEVFDSISEQVYSNEELTQIRLLLHTLFSKKFYHVPYRLGYYSEHFQFDDILAFIRKYEETGLIVSKADLSYLLDIYVARDRLISNSIANEVSSRHYSYMKKQFPFQFDNFCSFMNDESIDFSSCKYDRTKEFDFSMYVLFLTREDYRSIAGYFDPLIQTKSGQELLNETITTCWKKIHHCEEVYSEDTYQKFYPYAEKLASLTDYTLDYFLLDFVKREDYEKVNALCIWINRHDINFFSKSIGDCDNVRRNRQRIKTNVLKFFNETPLQELTEENISEYWKSLRDPFVEINKYPMKKDEFMSYSNIIKSRLDNLTLPEVKNMELCFSEGKSLVDYISGRGYNEQQALQMISLACDKLPDEKDKLLELQQVLQNQIVDRDETNKHYQELRNVMNNVKDASLLMLLFLNGSYSSMTEFYQDASLKFGFSQTRLRELIKFFNEGENDISDSYKKRREIITKNALEKVLQANRKRHQEKLESDIDMYGTEAIRIMKRFVDSDDKSIGKFCSSLDLSMKDFKFYRKLCSHVDQDISALVDGKAADIRNRFIGAMARTSNLVAREMVRCHKNHIPYDMVTHYEKYGYSPVFIKDFALSIGRGKEANTIDQYMNLYPILFKTISASEIATMERTSRYAPRNMYIDAKGKMSVSYLASDLEEATNELTKLEVPITKGTVFSMLKRIQGKKDCTLKVYQKK